MNNSNKFLTLVITAATVFCATTNAMNSTKEAELRRAMIDYKKAARIISQYAANYPDDKLVKAKLNEKARFEQEIASVPTVLPIMSPTLPVTSQEVTAEELQAEKERVRASAQEELAKFRAQDTPQAKAGTPKELEAFRAQDTPEAKAARRKQLEEFKATRTGTSRERLDALHKQNILEQRKGQ